MTATAPTATRRLYRSTRDKKLGGVCGGIAEAMGWDPTAVRLAAGLSLLLPGPQFLAYLVAWIILPTDETIFGWHTTQYAPPAPPMPNPPYVDHTRPYVDHTRPYVDQAPSYVDQAPSYADQAQPYADQAPPPTGDATDPTR